MSPLIELSPVQKELFDWLVHYIFENQHPPSIRQMMKAMGLRSPAPVQSRLKHLQKKGYIDWTEGRARTIRILQGQVHGIEIRGEIAAGGLIEPAVAVGEVERLDLAGMMMQPSWYALRVNGDSMIDEHIAPGDVVIVRPVVQADLIKDGTIVAAWVEGQGSTLKRFYRKANQITLEAANIKYKPIQVADDQVKIQGELVGVWRGYASLLAV
jgi:repressor LexA